MGDEPGTCLPYILSTVKLDVPVDRSTRRGVVMDGEHVILVKVSITNHFRLLALALALALRYQANRTETLTPGRTD